MVESVVIFQDGKEISISTHNKDIGRFTRQIKTADQVIFADPEVSRVASLILKNEGSHVRLEGIDINTQVLNEGYNKKSLLSIKDMIDRGEFTTKMAAQQTAAGLDDTKLTDKQIASVGNQAARQFQAQKLAQNFKDGMFERLTGQKADKPVNDGNGRMSRLLTTLLLYRSGFVVCKYISLEKKIEKTKDSYYDVLEESSENWYEGTNENTAFIKYILGIILSAYRDFEDRLNLIEDKISAYEMVERIAKKQIGKFTKSDIQEYCPTLARQTIEKALKQLCDEGKIEKHGQASKTFYTRKTI